MKKLRISLLVLIYSINLHSQWEMMNKPVAVPEVNFIVHHPADYIISVTQNKEVFRSSNDRSSWVLISVLDKSINCLFLSPDGKLYAGISTGYIVSTDIGVTWQEHQLGPSPGKDIIDMEFDSDGYIYMILRSNYAEAHYIYISSDNGSSWYNPSSGLPSSYYSLVGIEKDSSENIYVFTGSSYPSLYKSTTKGVNWELVPGSQDYSLWDFKIDSKNRIYVLGDSKISKTENFGITYTELYTGRFSKILLDANDNVYALIDHINIYFIPNDSGYTNSNIMFSSDNGQSWVMHGIPGLKANDILRLNDTLYIATSNGLRKSSFPLNNWSLCYEYTNVYTQVNEILRLQSNNRILLGTKRGLMISDDNGTTWNATDLLPNINVLTKDNSGNIYAADYNLYRSDDLGLSWRLPYQLSNWVKKAINNIFINDSGYIFIAQARGATNELYLRKSNNYGASWNTLWFHICACNASGTTYSIVESSSGKLFLSASFITYYPSASSFGRIYVKDPESGWTIMLDSKIAANMYLYDQNIYLPVLGYYTSPLGIMKSSDDGNTFIPLNNGLPNLNVYQLILKPEVFIAYTADGIYRSLDQGNYWFRLDHTGLSGNLLKIYYDHNKILYAITDEGVFKFSGNIPVELSSFTASSSNNTVQLSWSTASELNNYGFEIERSKDQADWRTIGFKEGNGTTTEHQNYTFTDDLFGVNSHKLYYRLKQIDYDGRFEYSNVLEVNVASLNFALHHNYPNPFNPSTKISWQSPVGSHQTLKVYDVLGNEVATLVDEYKEAGYHEMEFQLAVGNRQYASGIY
ncbi:MAG: hypothetical protein R6W68_05675, partial [Ignavibacteriaceae bacterium]